VRDYLISKGSHIGYVDDSDQVNEEINKESDSGKGSEMPKLKRNKSSEQLGLTIF
jgi:hypothetical protein